MITDNVNIYMIILIVIISFIGFLLKSLTISGALMATVVGILIQIGFGYKGLLLLGIFFGSSSVWSKFQQRKKIILQEKLAKGEQRDYIQVLANGGIPAFISILAILQPSIEWLLVFVVCIASANADTWASEIGSLSKRQPILITTLKKVEAGTSGAMSLLGTIAALLGALLIALVSYFLWENEISVNTLLIIALLGFIGNIFDTLLGATIQVKYRCNQCKLETEKRNHCDQPTLKINGIPLFNNDVVNFLSILLAGILAIFMF